MAKGKSQFVCQECGATYPKWSGKCEQCNAWNSLLEENASTGVGAGPTQLSAGQAAELVYLDGEQDEEARIVCGISELDRVTGGGFVKGSVLLLGGDPGIGKSTLLLQVCAGLAQRKNECVYISGEEAIAQIRLRANRLKCNEAKVKVVAETNVENIIATLKKNGNVGFVVVDSIQTLWTNKVESSPGTVSQVRSAAQAMIRYAKQTGAVLVLVGHVTKEGQIAGPRVVEHMVDAVLYFEGEGNYNFRILRGVKNRFGPTDEIGVFEMSDLGLQEASNPSELFMGERGNEAPGMAVFAAIEGRRPLLVEIQALVANSNLATPRRAVVGWDASRLAMVLAVLESHCGIKLGGHDVYLNVAGGFRIREPAADFAVAACLVSSLANRPLPKNSVWFGEVGLSGKLRAVSQTQSRIKECSKLGFENVFFAKGENEKIDKQKLNINRQTYPQLVEFVAEWINEKQQ